MELMSRIIKFLTLRKRYVYKKIFAYSPINIDISRTADIEINNRLTINQPWKPTFSNKAGRFDVASDAKVFINDVVIRGGVPL